MPLVGTREIAPIAASAPVMPTLDAGTWELPGAVQLQVMYEIDEAGMVSLLPPSLHPTIPPTVIFNITRVPQSSVGPFTLAEARIGCRSALRPRAFSARSYCDNADAAKELQAKWGYPVAVATVELHRHYDRAWGTVEIDGRRVLDVSLMNPEPISGADVQYLPNMNLARVLRDGEEVVRLVQVDPEYTFQKADRGKPRLDTFEPEAWELAGCVPVWPVSASLAVADMTLPKLRYLVDPTKNPLAAVEKV
jgi:hypothetical protein